MSLILRSGISESWLRRTTSIKNDLLALTAERSGHFRLESGHHTDRWLDLGQLFSKPASLRPFVIQLAEKVAAHQPDLICGPMTGGALLAELIADRLEVRFAFAERSMVGGRPHYAIPVSLRESIAGQRIAVVDDAISAGSAVGGTVADVGACRGDVHALAALILVSDRPHRLAASLRLPLEWLVDLPTDVWLPDECPLCRRGEPLSEP